MRKIFFITVIALFAISLGNAFAGPTEDRVTVLEGKVLTLEETVATQQTAIESLQSAVTALQNQSLNTRLTAVENYPAVQTGALNYMRLDTNELNGVSGPHVIFEGVNLHVQNGAGTTFERGYITDNPPNGLGNLIIGYNSIDPNDPPLDPADRNGSHNIVIGFANKFPGIFTLVHGWKNTANGHFSAAIAGDLNYADSWNAVVGGWRNVADGPMSVIVGGSSNQSSGYASIIVGGDRNMTDGRDAVIVGGSINTAGLRSVINGGGNNVADNNSVVCGGHFNSATGSYSTISGGESNAATGNSSSVSGGFTRTAIGDHDWVAGSLWEDQ